MDKILLENLVNQGMSLNELKGILNKGQTTIRYWLKKYNLKTKHNSFKDGYNSFKKVDKENQYCSGCQIKLNDNNSYYRKTKDIYHSQCKNCHSNYTLNKRLKFKEFCVNYKGGSCTRCGYDKVITALEFHHLNPNEKEIEPSKMMNKKKEFIKNELDKCILICSNCHREEHYRQDNNKKIQKSFEINSLSNFSKSILTGKNTNLPSCNICDTPLNEENKSKGKTSMCKPCDSRLVIENTVKSKQRAVEYMDGKCTSCGYDKCIRALEFHHIDSSKKSKTYNKRFRSWSFEKQKKELENCMLVCSNCHREIHSKDEWIQTP